MDSLLPFRSSLPLVGSFSFCHPFNADVSQHPSFSASTHSVSAGAQTRLRASSTGQPCGAQVSLPSADHVHPAPSAPSTWAAHRTSDTELRLRPLPPSSLVSSRQGPTSLQTLEGPPSPLLPSPRLELSPLLPANAYSAKLTEAQYVTGRGLPGPGDERRWMPPVTRTTHQITTG